MSVKNKKWSKNHIFLLQLQISLLQLIQTKLVTKYRKEAQKLSILQKLPDTNYSLYYVDIVFSETHINL